MKKLKKINICFITVLMVVGIFLNIATTAYAATDPDVQSKAAILVEADSGTVLYSKSADEKMYPASLTKMMTALVAIKACEDKIVSLDDVVTISSNVYFDISSDGSTQNILEGEEITLENLLYCMLLSSANEACNAVAEYVSGDIQTFVTQMNTLAANLGCQNTHFANTHGMPDENHYTTAHDLYLILREAIKYPTFTTIVGTEEYTMPATNLNEARTLKNTDNLIQEKSKYYYEYAKGGKTGYTDAAGYCLGSFAQRDGLTLISIVLGANSVIAEDGSTQIQSFSESKRLFQWGFSSFSYKTIVGTTNLVCELPVELGKGVNSVVVRPEGALKALLDNDIDMSQVELKTTIYSEEAGETLQAPITEGDILGEAEVYIGNTSYGKINLVANTTIELDKTKYMKLEIHNALTNKYVKLVIVALIALVVIYIIFIIVYNINRSKKKKMADALAKRRIEEVMRGESISSGKSFEEIVEMKNRHDEMTRK